MGVEVKAFYTCRNRRCRVQWWPVEIGPICPSCNLSGTYAGTVLKNPDPPPVPEEDD